MNSQDVISRFRKVKDSRTQVEDTWDWVERYISPYRGRFFKDEKSENSIEWRRPWVYDATAIMAAQNLASSLHARLTSASLKWFNLSFRDLELNEDQEALEWLEECSKICWEALQDSNFNVQISETYQDLVCYGTSIILEDQDIDDGDFTGLNFKSVPIKECYFETDHRGDVGAFYRHLQWTLLQIKMFFKDQPIPKYILDQINDKEADPNKKLDIIFCIYRRTEIKADENASNTAANMRPYGFRYVMLDSAETIGDIGGYYEMPAFVPRWRSTSSSIWGNSPAMIALSDTLTLNRTIELNLKAVEKALDPPTLTTSRGLISDLDLNAGGLTVVRDINELTTFESKARFDVTYQEMNRLRENINAYFFIPQLILPPMEGTPATATEISVRMQQLEALISPTLGRLQVDMLDPIIQRTFRILWRAEKFPDAPQSVVDSDAETEIEYTSPMAKTLDSSNAQAIERWVMTLGGLAEIHPEIMDIPDFDEIAKTLAKMLGVSAKLIKDKGKIDSERSERNELARQQAEGEAMQAQGAGMQAMNGE